MRTPGEGEATSPADGGRPGLTAARGAYPADTPRVRSLQAARAQAPRGSKAAARLLAFMEQRGLDQAEARGRRAAPPPAPHLARLAANGSGASPAELYQQGLAAGTRARARGPAQPAWQFLGPSSIPHGQTYGDGAGASPPVAGRVGAIAVDPSNPRHVLIGAANGGVWETMNLGRTWTPRTDDQPSLAIGAIAFDPTNPARVYAGTGEGNTLEVPGQGILRSDDGGATWKLTAADAFAGAFFFRLIVDPDDGRRLFAATERGVMRSTDAGATWTTLRSPLTWELSLGPGELLAAGMDGLQRSVNGGDRWTRVALPGGPTSFANVVGRMAVAHHRAGEVAYVFAARDEEVWLWRRERKGGPFAEVPLPSLDPPGAGDPGYGISQSWYDWCLAVAPDDADAVFLGAVDVFRGRLAGGRWSWDDISSRSDGDCIHPDQHTFALDPSDPHVLYAGNDGGVFRSPDLGDSWQALNKGLAITEFEYLAQHPRTKTWVIGGTQDNGTLRHRGRGTWVQIALGDGGDCGVNRASPRTCYHSYYGMSTERSRSGGDGWDDVTPPIPQRYLSLFYPPLEVNGKTLARAGATLWISDDEGDTWTEQPMPPVNPGTRPSGGRASAMTCASDTRLLLGRGDGRIFRFDRDAGGWGAAVELGSPRAAWLSDLLAPAATPDRYWVTYSTVGGGHVFTSADAGATWNDATGNLPDVPVNAIESDPDAPSTVWVATDAGVFRSTNRGRSWSLYGTGLPRALTVDLLFHQPLGLLRVGTRSRGVWEISVR